MKKEITYRMLGLSLGTACIATTAARKYPDLATFPIPEPQIKHSTVLED